MRKVFRMLKLCALTLSLAIFCEYFIYFIVLFQCSWPHDSGGVSSTRNVPLKAMLLADTHLLGSVKGHWFDKLRREWQMHRAFQTAVTLFQPHVVFVLGDLFDEGEWSKQDEFDQHVARFKSLFRLPENIPMYVVAGNHDMGFHYKVHPYLSARFNSAFNTSSVSLVTTNNIDFVLINSMAMEGDECFLCKPARIKLSLISKELKRKNTTRPIILQHFPMYRKSDSVCNEPDEAPANIKNDAFRIGWDCLAKESTKFILDKFHPRAIITGHTHHGCHVVHQDDIHEYTIPSFSWRNKNNPSFMLAIFSTDSYSVSKCYLPQETTVISIYIVGFLLIVIYFIKKR